MRNTTYRCPRHEHNAIVHGKRVDEARSRALAVFRIDLDVHFLVVVLPDRLMPPFVGGGLRAVRDMPPPLRVEGIFNARFAR